MKSIFSWGVAIKALCALAIYVAFEMNVEPLRFIVLATVYLTLVVSTIRLIATIRYVEAYAMVMDERAPAQRAATVMLTGVGLVFLIQHDYSWTALALTVAFVFCEAASAMIDEQIAILEDLDLVEAYKRAAK